MLRKRLIILMIGVLVISSLFVTGCSFSTVATVNGEKITQGMLDQQVRFYIADYEFQYPGTFDKEKSKILYQQFENNAKRDLIRQAMLLQEASKMGLKVTDAEVAKSLDGAKSVLGDTKKDKGYEKYLKTLKMNETEFKEALKKQILADKVKDEVTKNVTVSDAEVSDYYLKHKTDYKKTLPEIKDEVKADALKAKKDQVWLEFGTKLQNSSKIVTK